jgi:hypothetical protein
MNLDRLLPAKRLDVAHAAGGEDGNARLVKALADEAAIPLLRWRVHGRIERDDVHLWYSLRKRPPSLAPQLYARWQGEGADGHLVGEFRQDRRMAAAVFWTGIVFALGLLWLALQGGLAMHWAALGIAFFAGYPWLAWYMHENHVQKIEEMVDRALGTATAAPVPPPPRTAH